MTHLVYVVGVFHFLVDGQLQTFDGVVLQGTFGGLSHAEGQLLVLLIVKFD